jgi:predicted nucleotidyltransferase
MLLDEIRANRASILALGEEFGARHIRIFGSVARGEERSDSDVDGFRNILVHNYLGEIDPLTVEGVIDHHLQPLEACVRAMLDSAGEDTQGSVSD